MSPLPGDYACRNMGGTSGLLISFGEYLNGDGFSIYDHAEIFVGLPDKNGPYGYTMGAYPGGARLYPLQGWELTDTPHGFLWSTGKLGDLTPTDFQRKSIVALARACNGIPYSPEDYFALAAHRLRIPVPGLKDYIADSGHMICSQLVDWCYMKAGVHLFTDGRWPGYVTPADLANILLKNA